MGECLARSANPNQGAFIIDELPEFVEEAELREFEEFAVRCCSLGQITNALFGVGGQYRRSM